RPGSLLSYIIAKCGLTGEDDDQLPPVSLLPIPRPQLLEKLQEDGALVTRLNVTSNLPGLRALLDEESGGLLGIAWQGGTLDTPHSDVTFDITAKLATRARKRQTMGGQAATAAQNLWQAAKKVAQKKDVVTDGEVVLLDAQDKRHVIS